MGRLGLGPAGVGREGLDGDRDEDSDEDEELNRPLEGSDDEDVQMSDDDSASHKGLSSPGTSKTKSTERNTTTTIPNKTLSAKARGKKRAGSSSLSSDDQEDEEGKGDNKKPTLRELEERAYSRKSLHTYKADPLHRRKDALTPFSASERGARGRDGGRGQNRGRGRGQGRDFSQSRGHGQDRGRGRGMGRGRGNGRGDFGGRHRDESGDRTGRGQPNMKLRMEAMLERIKRDYAP